MTPSVPTYVKRRMSGRSLLEARLTGSGARVAHRFASCPAKTAGHPSRVPHAPWRTRARQTRATALLLALAAVSAASGCGYSTKRPFRTDIQTVHVEMFQSREFRRELEFRLTEAIIKRIEMDTPYRIGSKQTADATLSGEVLSVKNQVFGDDLSTGRPREIGATVVVRFRFQDMRSGEILAERPRFVYQTSYIPPVGETFTVSMTRALDGMAEQIVETMETDW